MARLQNHHHPSLITAPTRVNNTLSPIANIPLLIHIRLRIHIPRLRGERGTWPGGKATVHLRHVESSPDYLPREPHLDMIGQLTPPLDFVSILVLNVTDDVVLFLRHLEDCAHPVCVGPLLRIGGRAPRPFPETLDVGPVGRVEAAAIEVVEVETNGVRNRYEHLTMGEIVDLDSDLYLARALAPVTVGREGNTEKELTCGSEFLVGPPSLLQRIRRSDSLIGLPLESIRRTVDCPARWNWAPSVLLMWFRCMMQPGVVVFHLLSLLYVPSGNRSSFLISKPGLCSLYSSRTVSGCIFASHCQYLKGRFTNYHTVCTKGGAVLILPLGLQL